MNSAHWRGSLPGCVPLLNFHTTSPTFTDSISHIRLETCHFQSRCVLNRTSFSYHHNYQLNHQVTTLFNLFAVKLSLLNQWFHFGVLWFLFFKKINNKDIYAAKCFNYFADMKKVVNWEVIFSDNYLYPDKFEWTDSHHVGRQEIMDFPLLSHILSRWFIFVLFFLLLSDLIGGNTFWMSHQSSKWNVSSQGVWQTRIS